MAAAFSNAGGLGIFAVHNAGSPEAARQWIRKMKSLTTQPWGCNLTILPTIGQAPPYEEYAKVMVEEGVKIIETAGSAPHKFVPAFKKAGIFTIHKCVTVRHALSALKVNNFSNIYYLLKNWIFLFLILSFLLCKKGRRRRYFS